MILDIVKKIINQWDPVELLSHAPDDEYHSEIERIWKLLKESKDLNVLAEGIFNIFKDSFSNVFTKTIEDCTEIASKLLEMQIK